jgi:hypothetical protein
VKASDAKKLTKSSLPEVIKKEREAEEAQKKSMGNRT